jgi:hypothetical protein
MTDADKIKYLEGWVERLSYDLAIYKSSNTYNQTRCDALGRQVDQLETELAAAKADNATLNKTIEDWNRPPQSVEESTPTTPPT